MIALPAGAVGPDDIIYTDIPAVDNVDFNGPGQADELLALDPEQMAAAIMPDIPLVEQQAVFDKVIAEDPLPLSVEGAVPADAIDVVGQPEEDIASTADALRKVAVEREPELTTMVTDIADARGGEMYKLEFNVKGAGSLADKLERFAATEDTTVFEAANAINDANRYTIIFPRDVLTVRANEVVADLKAAGWEQYDDQWKNYFQAGNEYKGLNMNFVNARGEKFELQIHTPASAAAVEKNHLIYEVVRKLPKGDPRRTALVAEMAANMADPAVTPVNAAGLPGSKAP